MTKPSILIVEDNASLRETLRENLELDGYDVHLAANANELLVSLKSRTADTILLDIILPDGDGLALISRIREHTQAPIIVVSGKGQLVDKVVGLEMGADDYLSKPFEMRELLARVKANVRRFKAQASEKDDTSPDNSIRFSGWVLDRSRFQIFDTDGNPGGLTTKEFKLLEALCLAPNRVLSRDQLLDLARDGDFDVFDRAVDIQITRIRKKIGDDASDPQIIKTVRGAGYMMVINKTKP